MMSISDPTTNKLNTEIVKPKIQFTAITLFPEMFKAVTEHGVISRAIKQQAIAVNTVNPRDFTHDKHRTVDDRPYGGGPGMLMKAWPLEKAIDYCRANSLSDKPKVIYLSPQGKPLNQALAKKLSKETHLILIAGRYEGIDERLLEQQVDLQISLGDFVLSGGELPAMTLIDSVSRLVPKVLGHSESAEQDSFSDGLLDHPHYTRPEDYHGSKVPEVLLSGNHQKIAEWRLQQRLGRTWLNRPDLLREKKLTQKEQDLLKAFQQDHLDD